MAYKQNPGRGDQPKTGAGVEGITNSIQKGIGYKFGSAVKNELAYMNASAEEKSSFNRASASSSNVGGTKSNPLESKLYGAGSAKASESSAEAMTLKQNENQLPGGKGFKGAKSYNAIMPNMKPDSPDGTVKEYRNSTVPSFKMGVSYNSSFTSPGNLGKLETLATKQTYDNGKPLKMDNVIKASFGAADKFNQEMGGTQNPLRASRDLGYSRSTDDRKNVFKGATDPSGNQKIDLQITKEIKRSAESGNLRNQPIYARYQPGNGSYHLEKGNIENLIGIASAAGKKGESAMNELNTIVNRNKPRAEQGGFESTYKQKYEYPTDVTYDASSDKYSGLAKGKTYMSPESTMNQNIMTSKAADAKMNFSQYNAKRKANLGIK